MSSQGACHSGFCCSIFSLRTKLDDCEFCWGVEPLAFGPFPAPDFRIASAVEVPPLTSDFLGMPSIIFAVAESDPSCFCFFLLPAATAVFCFAASAGGSSRTFSYSLLNREDRPARSARCKEFSGGLSP